MKIINAEIQTIFWHLSDDDDGPLADEEMTYAKANAVIKLAGQAGEPTGDLEKDHTRAFLALIPKGVTSQKRLSLIHRAVNAYIESKAAHASDQ